MTPKISTDLCDCNRSRSINPRVVSGVASGEALNLLITYAAVKVISLSLDSFDSSSTVPKSKIHQAALARLTLQSKAKH